MSDVLVLSHADVHAALAPEDCERAIVEVLIAQCTGAAYAPLRNVMIPPGAPGFMGLMPAYASGESDPADPGVFALKAICLMPENPRRGLDAHQGVVTLFDGDTGIPTAILSASAVTEIRTAAVTAAATRPLARRDAAVLAILGSGVQARAHLRSLRDVRDWTQVRVFSPNPAHLQALVDHSPVALPITAAASAWAAVEGADVVVTATSSKEPVLKHAWLRDDAHVNAIGASSPSARELELETVAAAALFCDSRESVRNEAGEFRLAVEAGLISGEQHIRAELGEVLSGTADGRTAGDGLTLFRSLGIGIEDLAAATQAVRTAERLGVGTRVAL
jgi:ornithine cyclodeaminase/alanine dehydrogenase-like protein (mu-crystallin family)